jgi:hypothetical protein
MRRWEAGDPLGALRRAPNAQNASNLLLQVASVGLIASLSFICRGLLGPSHHQRTRRLSPPPLLEPTRHRQGKAPPSEKTLSESGVHPAIPSGGGASWFRAG